MVFIGSLVKRVVKVQKKEMSSMTLALLTFLSFPSFSQADSVLVILPAFEDYYTTSIGIGIGWPVAAVTMKHFYSKRNAVEVLAAPHYGGGYLVALFERHDPARLNRVLLYYGGGLFAGMFSGSSLRDPRGNYYDQRTVSSVGFAAVLGMEFNFNRSPYFISFDVKPRVGVYNPGGSIIEGAITLKYGFGL